MQQNNETLKKYEDTSNVEELKNQIQILENMINNQAAYIEQLENSFSLRLGRRLGFLFKVKQFIYYNYRKLNRSKLVLCLKKKLNTDENRKKHTILPKKSYNLSAKSTSKLKVASILDEFSYNCFKYEAEFIPLNNRNFISQLEELKPDFFFSESAWKGSNGQWKVGQEQNYSKLVEITNYCKTNNIPTIFWCKEDPVHFEHFIPVAKLFDYVFTTDANMIGEYKKRCGHEDVYALPFAAQPHIHNPIKEYDREEKVCFAGSYYRQKYQERAKILRMMLDASQKVGLDIYDRNFNSGIENYKFPDEYTENVKGVLPYDQISKAYKGYKVNINVNTVTESPTMFSRRVFESLACNTPIISNYSKGVEAMFDDIVHMSENESDYRNHLQYLMTNPLDYHALALKGLRTVLNQHTYHKRMNEILDKLSVKSEINEPKILVISQTENIDDVIECFNKQTYEYKQLLIISNQQSVEVSENIKVIDVNNVNDIMSYVSKFEYVALLNDSYYYGKYYLTDLVNTVMYQEADIISKSLNIKYEDDQFMYTTDNDEYIVYDGTCDLNVSLVKSIIINQDNVLNYLGNNINQENLVKFKIDSFNVWTTVNEVKIELLDEKIQA